MNNLGSSVNTTSNTETDYFDPVSTVDIIGDTVTYSTNTLESAVTVTWPSE